MMTDLVYLADSYKKTLKSRVVSCDKKGDHWEIVLDKTIFYPQGGGQPSDKGEIVGPAGRAKVKHVHMQDDIVIHECSLDGSLSGDESVECKLDWNLRYRHMRVHSAGHIVHEAVMATVVGLTPRKGEHGDKPYIEYQGSIPIDKKYAIEAAANAIVDKNLALTAEFVTLEELTKRSSYIPEHLPKHKPLRILSIDGYDPIPDGGTQVKTTKEVGAIAVGDIVNDGKTVRVYYTIQNQNLVAEDAPQQHAADFISQLLEVQRDLLEEIRTSSLSPLDLRLKILGGKGVLAQVSKQIVSVAPGERQQAGIVLNQVKQSLVGALDERGSGKTEDSWVDVTAPGIEPPHGHLHLVSQAIGEITGIFERIGFTRVRHPEVDWDWYAFGSLNMPPNHPARDEWETFFIKEQRAKSKEQKFSTMVLTPHTSNGQVREMEKGKLPIRMINIAKCYRRQLDVSHTPMFHQFEGLYVDKNVSIGNLKGVMDFFFKNYYGPERVSRLRPFHFQFTEPSFEVDINCGVCLGKGCKLCKEGWLELGGAGMVHPVVLKNGGIDPNIYNGFAFGWGIERVTMMKSGTKLDDIRILYGNDVRFLEQF